MGLDADKDFFRCGYCERVHFPNADGSGVRDLGVDSDTCCPLCAHPLHQASAGGVRMLYCARCRGMLVGTETFLTMIDALRAGYDGPPVLPHPAASEELDRRIRCPRCRRDMDTHPYAGPGNIVIDNCPACQLNWLDCRELDRVVRAPGWPPPLSDPRTSESG